MKNIIHYSSYEMTEILKQKTRLDTSEALRIANILELFPSQDMKSIAQAIQFISKGKEVK